MPTFKLWSPLPVGWYTNEGHTRESGKLLKMLLSELCFSEITSVLAQKIRKMLRAGSYDKQGELPLEQKVTQLIWQPTNVTSPFLS